MFDVHRASDIGCLTCIEHPTSRSTKFHPDIEHRASEVLRSSKFRDKSDRRSYILSSACLRRWSARVLWQGEIFARGILGLSARGFFELLLRGWSSCLFALAVLLHMGCPTLLIIALGLRLKDYVCAQEG